LRYDVILDAAGRLVCICTEDVKYRPAVCVSVLLELVAAAVAATLSSPWRDSLSTDGGVVEADREELSAAAAVD